jgi:hypothetical protein
MEYQDMLNKQFGHLQISVVKHDTSPTGYPLYILVELGKTPKDKGMTALDLGNYVYRRFGVAYMPVPEYVGRGKSTAVRFYVSWDNATALLDAIKAHYGKSHIKAQYVPFEFRALSIQEAAQYEQANDV